MYRFREGAHLILLVSQPTYTCTHVSIYCYTKVLYDATVHNTVTIMWTLLYNYIVATHYNYTEVEVRDEPILPAKFLEK